jgi:transposase
MKGMLTMSAEEQKRVDLLRQWERGELQVTELAVQMERSERQTYRVVARYKKEGLKGIVQCSRGRPSNRAFDVKFKKKAEELYEKNYRDYGPTLLGEVLLKNHGIKISDETLRRWFAGKWVVGRKSRKHRRKRERRNAIGEMIQFDGSDHDWFEGRHPPCTLLVAVDDASNKVFARMAPSENAEDALHTWKSYCEQFGIPQSTYTDRHKVYKAEKEGHHTDLSRAMECLGVKMIYAKSPQAKGRVERTNRTLQDRLVKAMRLKNISTIAEANRFLEEEFLDEFNARFAHPEDLRDVHRPLKGYDVKNIFCFQQERVVRSDYTIQFERRFIQLFDAQGSLPKPRSIVILRQWLDGSLHVFYRMKELAFKLLTEKPKPKIKVKTKPKADHPWRKFRRSKPSQRQTSWPWNN